MSEASYRLIDDIRKLIGNGDVEQAIDRLKSVLQADRSEPYNEILLHESRYRRLRREERKGTLVRESFQAELNKLTVSLLEMLEELPPRFRENVPSGCEAVLSVQGGPQYEDLAFQKILGIHNLKQISWIERGLHVSRGVCRILTPNGFGTGFLISHEMIMTNNHVISDTMTAGDSQAEFNYQEDASGGFLPAARYHLDANRFRTNSALDYTLVGIRADPSKPSVESWGALQINPNADPVPSEHVTIIQHPNGGYKQIVLSANWVISSTAALLHYTTDTMPGSSGSPVFNDSWHVIAIHHAGGQLHKSAKGEIRYVNEGILMSAIIKDAGQHWPN